jgi:hypothetical protein
VEKLLRTLGIRITPFQKYQVNVYYSTSKKLMYSGFFYRAFGGGSGSGEAVREDKVYDSGKKPQV